MEFGCLKTQSLSFSWRFPIGFQVLFLMILLLAAPFYPESPRHLAKIGNLEARQVLSQCRVDRDESVITGELEEIIGAIRIEATSTSHSFSSILLKGQAAYSSTCHHRIGRPSYAKADGHRLYCCLRSKHVCPVRFHGRQARSSCRW